MTDAETLEKLQNVREIAQRSNNKRLAAAMDIAIAEYIGLSKLSCAEDVERYMKILAA